MDRRKNEAAKWGSRGVFPRGRQHSWSQNRTKSRLERVCLACEKVKLEKCSGKVAGYNEAWSSIYMIGSAKVDRGKAKE